MPSTLYITGRTWAFRRDLARLGGHWDPRLEAWLVPAVKRPQLDALATIADIDIAVLDPMPLKGSRP